MASRNDHVDTLIKVTGRLIGVMDREVELLRSMEVSEIEAIQDEKTTLTLAYEECIRAVAGEPALLQRLEPAQRAELSELAVRFDASLAENARALHAVRDSHDRMLKAIVDAVAETRAPRRSYAPDGSMPPGACAAQPVSLSFDRQL